MFTALRADVGSSTILSVPGIATRRLKDLVTDAALERKLWFGRTLLLVNLERVCLTQLCTACLAIDQSASFVADRALVPIPRCRMESWRAACIVRDIAAILASIVFPPLSM